MTEFHEPLSPAGELRRAAILNAALRSVRRRRHQRRALQAAGVVAVALVAAFFLPPFRGPSRVPDAPGQQLPVKELRGYEIVSASRPTFVRTIRDDPTIAARLVIHTAEPECELLDDRGLLVAVAETGLNGAVARINGQMLLILGP